MVRNLFSRSLWRPRCPLPARGRPQPRYRTEPQLSRSPPPAGSLRRPERQVRITVSGTVDNGLPPELNLLNDPSDEGWLQAFMDARTGPCPSTAASFPTSGTDWAFGGRPTSGEDLDRGPFHFTRRLSVPGSWPRRARVCVYLQINDPVTGQVRELVSESRVGLPPQPPVRVACQARVGVRPAAAPSRCIIHGLGTGHLGLWILSGLRWRGWWDVQAVARGSSLEATTPPRLFPVRVVLRYRQDGCDGRRWYSEALITLRGRTLRHTLATCPGRGS